MKYIIAILLTFGIFQLPLAEAAPKKKVSKQITCPPIIGDKSDATIYAGATRPSRARFSCYRNSTDAKNDGFFTAKAAAKKNFTGWYRLRLTLVKDTCSPIPVQGGPVLFLQIKQSGNGVFGEFCPTLGSFSGISDSNGFTISELHDSTILTVGKLCDDDLVRSHQFLEFSQVIKDGAAFGVKYSIVRRCISQASAANSCTREYTGVAFHETHPIWPSVANNINDLPLGCAQAMTKCVDCHPGINGVVPTAP